MNDEILNKYIDNELSYNEVGEITEHIKSCNECLAKLKALKVAERQLKNLSVYSTSEDFTKRVMQKISSSVVHFKPKKSYFFRFVFSIFILAALAVCVAAFASIIPYTSGEGINSFVDTVNKNAAEIFSSYKIIFDKQVISIVGSVVLLIVLVTLYLIYESQKQVKDHLNKLR